MRATRIAGALAIIAVGIGFGVVSPASAGRAVHAGETIAVSKTSGLTDGEKVRPQ